MSNTRLAHSFWSKPALHPAYEFGRWPSFDHLRRSYLLSAKQARKHHGNIELFTDSVGAEHLDLTPYNRVHVTLDDIPDVDSRCFMAGKLHTYARLCKSSVPWLHLDGDFYMFEPLPAELLAGRMVASHSEGSGSYSTVYRKADEMLRADKHLPAMPWDGVGQTTFAHNMSLCGGTDHKLLTAYCDKVLHLLEHLHTTGKLTKLFDQLGDRWHFLNCVIEQLTYSRMAVANGFVPTCLRTFVDAKLISGEPIEGYAHALGMLKTAKTLYLYERKAEGYITRGLGDKTADVLSMLGMAPCEGCVGKIEWLNKARPTRG